MLFEHGGFGPEISHNCLDILASVNPADEVSCCMCTGTFA